MNSWPRVWLLLFFLFSGYLARSQTLIFDPQHFATAEANGLARETAEKAHQNSLQKIKTDIDNISLNISAVALVQDIIHEALTTVNGTLKNGLAIKEIAELSTEIIGQYDQILALTRDDPALLLFAQNTAQQMKNRGAALVTQVSSFVLKEGDNVLMDYEKRDFLLRKVILELQVMRALSYSMYKTMYWARVDGLLKTADPFKSFINRDMQLSNQVLLQHQLLKMP